MTKEHGIIREDRYLVLKRTDIAYALSEAEKLQLMALSDKVAFGRVARAKPPLACVIVEDDWPETPVIWSMIEARMTGGVDFVQWQAARIVELETLLKDAGASV